MVAVNLNVGKLTWILAWTDLRHMNTLYCPCFVYMCFTLVSLLIITFYFEISKYQQCYHQVVYTTFPLRYNRQSNVGQDSYVWNWTRSVSWANKMCSAVCDMLQSSCTLYPKVHPTLLQIFHGGACSCSM